MSLCCDTLTQRSKCIKGRKVSSEAQMRLSCSNRLRLSKKKKKKLRKFRKLLLKDDFN